MLLQFYNLWCNIEVAQIDAIVSTAFFNIEWFHASDSCPLSYPLSLKKGKKPFQKKTGINITVILLCAGLEWIKRREELTLQKKIIRSLCCHLQRLLKICLPARKTRNEPKIDWNIETRAFFWKNKYWDLIFRLPIAWKTIIGRPSIIP